MSRCTSEGETRKEEGQGQGGLGTPWLRHTTDLHIRSEAGEAGVENPEDQFRALCRDVRSSSRFGSAQGPWTLAVLVSLHYVVLSNSF